MPRISTSLERYRSLLRLSWGSRAPLVAPTIPTALTTTNRTGNPGSPTHRPMHRPMSSHPLLSLRLLLLSRRLQRPARPHGWSPSLSRQKSLLLDGQSSAGRRTTGTGSLPLEQASPRKGCGPAGVLQMLAPRHRGAPMGPERQTAPDLEAARGLRTAHGHPMGPGPRADRRGRRMARAGLLRRTARATETTQRKAMRPRRVRMEPRGAPMETEQRRGTGLRQPLPGPSGTVTRRPSQQAPSAIAPWLARIRASMHAALRETGASRR